MKPLQPKIWSILSCIISTCVAVLEQGFKEVMYLAKITQQGSLVDLILSDPKARERHLSGGGELGSIPHLRGELWTPGWLDLHAGWPIPALSCGPQSSDLWVLDRNHSLEQYQYNTNFQSQYIPTPKWPWLFWRRLFIPSYYLWVPALQFLLWWLQNHNAEWVTFSHQGPEFLKR